MADVWHALWRTPSAFFTWWTGELAGLFPTFAKRSSASSRSCLLLIYRGGETLLVEQAGRRGEKQLERAADDRNSDLLHLADRRYRNWPVVVRLGSDLGLRKLVDLPLVAPEELGQLLHFELDRLTPFKADDVSFAWRVLESDRDKNRMRVEIELAPKALIDNIRTLVAEYGREVERVELEGGSDDTLDLMPRSPEDGKTDSRGWTRHLLPLLVIGLIVTAVALPIRKQQAVIDGLDEQIALLRGEAEKSLDLRQELESLATKRRFLVEAKNNRVTMTETLAELTRLIPDHSHILQLQIRDSVVELNGLADQASELIAILDQSPMLSSPQFRSPVTRDPRADKERFQISVNLVDRPS